MQISEGTPSPSALPTIPPDFSARKILSYDETSQDTPNTSFEGEREVVVKTEPVIASETVGKEAEDADRSVIIITESPVKSHVTVKAEPMDTTDSAIVKQEASEEISADQTAVHAVVKQEPEVDESSNSEVDTISGNAPVKEEGESGTALVKEEVVQEVTDSVTPSQESSEAVPKTVAVVKESEAMVTDASDHAVSDSVIGTVKAVSDVPKSPATQGSGGSTPVQDERSCTPVKALEDCPGTPVQDEPMVE